MLTDCSSSSPNTCAEPCPGPPAIRKIAPLGVPRAGTTSTCSEIEPGTWPVRSSGTTTWEQMRPGVVPHCVAVEPAVGRPGARPENRRPGKRRGPDPRLEGRRRRAARAEKRERREQTGGDQPAENARPSTDTDPRQGT